MCTHLPQPTTGQKKTHASYVPVLRKGFQLWLIYWVYMVLGGQCAIQDALQDWVTVRTLLHTEKRTQRPSCTAHTSLWVWRGYLTHCPLPDITALRRQQGDRKEGSTEYWWLLLCSVRIKAEPERDMNSSKSFKGEGGSYHLEVHERVATL